MTMAQFWQGTPLMVDYTPGSAVNSGDVVIVGNIPCVCHRPIAASALGSLAVALGAYIMAADAAYGDGTAVFWDTAKQQVTTTPSSTTYPFGTVVGGPSNSLSDGGSTGAAGLCLVFHLPEGVFAAGTILGKPGTTLTLYGLLAESATDTITAHSGGTQAAALALTTEINRLTVVAAAGDSVKLPLAQAGLDVVVVNSGANNCQVFGSGTDTINDQATATGITQMANSVCLYVCTTAAPAGKYYCEGAGGGYSGQLATILTAAAVTAHSGGTQAAGFQLVAGYNRLGTVAAQGDSVLLPPAAIGLTCTIDNRGAQPAQVFGNGTDTINGIATATGLSHGVGQIATYFCTASGPGGNWDVQFSQAQQPGIVTLSGAADAIPPHVPHTYVVTKAGVDAMTLAAPTATTDDGLIIVVTSNTANAHTITATGLLQTGTASVNVATFAAQKGAGVTLMAYQGKWNVLSSVGITFS